MKRNSPKNSPRSKAKVAKGKANNAAKLAKGKGKSGENIKVTARIRPFLPWESDKQLYVIQQKNVLAIPKLDKQSIDKEQYFGNISEQEMLSMRFDNIYDKDIGTQETFDGFAKTLCDKLLESGCNALLIAYGQTGSGKTFTLLGNPGKDDGAKGILTMSVEYLMKSAKVEKCFISAKEVYSTNATKVEMFDLFDPKNVTASNEWHLKKGSKNIPDEKTVKHELTKTNINKMICLAQRSAHYAPTGKNPQSSRGHIMYLITLKFKDGRVPHFICCDLAGSEGATAITPSFIAKVGKSTAKVRMMEGGAINYGLTQIRDLLKEVGSKSGCGKVMGSGLRFLLWPYVQQKNAPAVSVLFTISPSVTNYRPTMATFRTCKAMAALKIVPIKVVKKVSSEDIILNLKATIREQQMVINKLRNKVDELEGNDKLQNKMRKMKNEGVINAHLEATSMKGLTQESLVEAGVEEKEDDEHEKNQVTEFNLKDLTDQKKQIEAMKKKMEERLKQKDVKNELLSKELKQVQKELDHINDKIKQQKVLDESLQAAIEKDKMKNGADNERISMFLIEQFGDLLTATEDVDDETVRIRKSDLIDIKVEMQNKDKPNIGMLVHRLDALCKSHGQAEHRGAIKLNKFIIQVSGHDYIPNFVKNKMFEAMSATNRELIERKICKAYMHNEALSEIAFRVLHYLEQNELKNAEKGHELRTDGQLYLHPDSDESSSE